MLAQPYDPEKPRQWVTPGHDVYIQPKINGNRCKAIVNLEEQKVTLLSSQGYPKPFFHKIKSQLLDLVGNWRGIADQTKQPIRGKSRSIHIFDGELYNPNMSVQDIGGICRTTTIPHPEEHRLEYHIFDTVSGFRQEIRIIKLMEVFSYWLPNIHYNLVMVPTSKIHIEPNCHEILRDQMISKGYEGVIFRRPEALYQEKKTFDLLKYKPRYNGIFPIVSMTEEISIEGEYKDSLGAFELETFEGKKFKVGTGFTRRQRKLWWDNPETIILKEAEIHFSEYTNDNIPFQPVFKRLI